MSKSVGEMIFVGVTLIAILFMLITALMVVAK